MTNQETSIEETNVKNKDVQILILRPSEEKIDFTGLVLKLKIKLNQRLSSKRE